MSGVPFGRPIRLSDRVGRRTRRVGVPEQVRTLGGILSFRERMSGPSGSVHSTSVLWEWRWCYQKSLLLRGMDSDLSKK